MTAGDLVERARRPLGRLGTALTGAVRDLFADDGPQWAAAIAYYSLLSLFPLLLAVVSVSTFFVNPDWVIARATETLGEYVPRGEEQIAQVVKEAVAARGPATLASVAALVWTGSRVLGAISRALNIAYDARRRSFLANRVVELLMLLALGALFGLALLLQFTLNFYWHALQLPRVDEGRLVEAAQSVLPAGLLLLAFFLLYRYVPKRTVHWQAALAGAVLAVTLFLGLRLVFMRYLFYFTDYSLIYGSFAAAIVLILWVWLAALLLLFGAQFSARVQQEWLEAAPA